MRIASLTILCLALAAVPAFADYSNGAINGSVDAWTINFGYIVSDTFVADSSSVIGFQFGVWEFPGDTLSAVDWSITSGENSGTVYGSGTASHRRPVHLHQPVWLQHRQDHGDGPERGRDQRHHLLAQPAERGLSPAATRSTGMRTAAHRRRPRAPWARFLRKPSQSTPAAPIPLLLSPAASCCLVLASWAWPEYCVASCSKQHRPSLVTDRPESRSASSGFRVWRNGWLGALELS